MQLMVVQVSQLGKKDKAIMKKQNFYLKLVKKL